MSKGNKKEQFVPQAEAKGADKAKSKGTLVGVIAGLVIAAVVGFFVLGGGPQGIKVVSAENGVVKVKVADVNDGQAHFYQFNGGQKQIKFFVLKSSDGIIRAAFDACDVCYREKKGYRQEGDTMVCNNCGQRFPSVRINEIKGGCNPSPLNRSIQGEYVVFNVSDIETGGFYF